MCFSGVSSENVVHRASTKPLIPFSKPKRYYNPSRGTFSFFLTFQTKGNEINALLLTLPPILEYLDEIQRQEVDQKVDPLHDRWIKLKNALESRLDLASIYVKFHAEADIVGREIDKLEQSLLRATPDMSDESFKDLEERWESLLPLFQSAKNTGLTFTNATSKVNMNLNWD